MYANENIQKDKINKLIEMGFTETQSREALQKYGWEEEAAANSLLEGN
jgi:uncharacterized UBP type Zn finger protein